MIETELNHFSVVQESLDGVRAVDEDTYAAIAILGDRLERLKKMDGVFEGVGFSPAVKRLCRQRSAVAAV
jgi:hypothetical protein